MNLANRGSKWYSRTMGLLGTLILLFLIVHIAHFWVPARFGGLEEVPGKNYHDSFRRMVEVFQSPVVVIIYILACISLAYHLLHGFQSSFRTLGLHNTRYLAIVKSLGIAFSIVVPLLFALMPIAIHFGWVGYNN
jgi:succinate dehydrogenase / fumarate reductase, cytochrome b subunit